MVIILDANVWQKLVELMERGIPSKGTIILEKHYIERPILHWVKDLSGTTLLGKPKLTNNSKLLGRVELVEVSHTTISSISKEQANAAGFGSKESLKRVFASYLGYPLAKELDIVTIAQLKIVEVEKYWCAGCSSVNLDFLKKNIVLKQLPFGCFDCGIEFYTDDMEKDSPPWTKFPKLEKRYCEEEIKKIPADQEPVLAVVGEKWLEI